MWRSHHALMQRQSTAQNTAQCLTYEVEVTQVVYQPLKARQIAASDMRNRVCRPAACCSKCCAKPQHSFCHCGQEESIFLA